MASFNKFERQLSGMLSAFPGIKRNAKYFYQAIQRSLYPRTSDYESALPIERISPSGNHCFFGYYDICPENINSGLVLYHSLFDKNKVKLHVFDRINNQHKNIGMSEAFNFQFGTRLQWIGEKNIIYNTYNEKSGRYESNSQDLTDGSSTNYPYPVLSVNHNSFYSIDFAHLGNIGSEYGYNAHALDYRYREPEYGILCVSLQTKRTEEIVSLADVLKNSNADTASNTRHFINHLSLSPDGRFAVFLHRWIHSSGRSEHLWIIDMSNFKKEILHKGMTSHYCWKNSRQLIAYISKDRETGYFLIDIEDRTFIPIREMNLASAGDGHPTSAGEDTIVFDSYPDRSGMQSLYVYRNGNTIAAGRFFAPLYKDPYYRTDLHPRLTKDGRRIYIDSQHKGERGLYCLSL